MNNKSPQTNSKPPKEVVKGGSKGSSKKMGY